ncbi:uncharacterized protein LOC143854772 [Tasmannia lanceolata]|uniref:uncharacterized protein LOC143854772 n=1 Tax=Tasmannia lanceolata TaxID=3420 RepID=UPI004063DAAE
MVLKERNGNAHLGFQRKSSEPVDHWAFLEEIDAPMWVDLALEDQFMENDIDDAWFQKAHPFHQRSSYQLISSVSLSSEAETKSSDLLCSSPKLLDSVSRSRGKDYKSRKWESVKDFGPIDKQHPIRVLGEKTSFLASGSDFTCNTSYSNITCIKPVTSFGNLKSTLNPKTSFMAESNSSSTITSESPRMRPKASYGDSKITSNSKGSIIGENNQQPMISEMSRHTFGQTIGLLSAMRISLTRRCNSRHASRVEVKESRLSKDHKSSSSKSSVGSSSNPRSNLTKANFGASKERTPEKRKDKSAALRANNKERASNVVKISRDRLADRNSNSNLKWGGKSTTTKTINQQSKSKVLYPTAPRKPLWSRNVEESLKERVVTKAKQTTSDNKFHRVAGRGKENAPTCASLNQKALGCSMNGFNGLPDQKGKTSGRNQGRNQTNVVQRRHFR